MAFQDFLDDREVTDIPPEFSEAMDTAGAPALVAVYALPTPAIVGILQAAVPPAIIALTGAPLPAAAGAALLMLAIETDIQATIGKQLGLGTVGLAKPVPLGVPGGPVSPVALAAGPAALNPAFGLAVLDWAISLVPPVDPRIISPFTV